MPAREIVADLGEHLLDLVVRRYHFNRKVGADRNWRYLVR